MGVEFKLGHKVEKVNLEKSEVNLTVEKGDKKSVEIFESVVCTVPLGVLKADCILFEPRLPDYKQDAIKRLGFGNLNKIVMHFEDRFWDDKLDTFGNVRTHKFFHV